MMPKSTPSARHWFVTGRVQGVSFRYYTQKQAEQLGLHGWVRNLADGRVEVWACGDAQQLEALDQWLAVGPTLARVDAVEQTTEQATDELQGFEIRSTTGD